jgi:hypothetical protein
LQDTNREEGGVRTMRLTRRQMLTAGGAFLAATAGRAGLEFLERMDAHDGWNCRFSQPLRILPTLNPVRKDAEADFYEITQKEADVRFCRANEPEFGATKECSRAQPSGPKGAVRSWFAKQISCQSTPLRIYTVG